jgi:hypothetical protein
MVKEDLSKPTPKEIAVKQEPTSRISKHGLKVISIIDKAQEVKEDLFYVNYHALDGFNQYFLRHNNASLHIDQAFTPRVVFGDLDNPKKTPKITLSALFNKADANGNGVPLSYGKEILFGKDMAVDLLSHIEPGKTVRAEGKGDYHEYSKTFTPDAEISNNLNYNYDRHKTIGLILELSLDSRHVVFRFTMEGKGVKDISQELIFEDKGIPIFSRLFPSSSK